MPFYKALEGKTVIVVTHRQAAIEGLVDEVVAFRRGAVASGMRARR